MRLDRRSALRAAALLVWLALFSALYTAGELAGLWPQLLPGALRDVDLAAGFAGAVGLCFWLLRRRVPNPSDRLPTNSGKGAGSPTAGT